MVWMESKSQLIDVIDWVVDKVKRSDFKGVKTVMNHIFETGVSVYYDYLIKLIINFYFN